MQVMWRGMFSFFTIDAREIHEKTDYDMYVIYVWKEMYVVGWEQLTCNRLRL